MGCRGPADIPGAEARMAAIVDAYELDDDACTVTVQNRAERFVPADVRHSSIDRHAAGT